MLPTATTFSDADEEGFFFRFFLVFLAVAGFLVAAEVVPLPPFDGAHLGNMRSRSAPPPPLSWLLFRPTSATAPDEAAVDDVGLRTLLDILRGGVLARRQRRVMHQDTL